MFFQLTVLSSCLRQLPLMWCEPFDHDRGVVTLDQMEEGQEVVLMMVVVMAAAAIAVAVAVVAMKRIIIHYHAEDQLTHMVLTLTTHRTTIRIYSNKSNNHTVPETLSPMSSEQR